MRVLLLTVLAASSLILAGLFWPTRIFAYICTVNDQPGKCGCGSCTAPWQCYRSSGCDTEPDPAFCLSQNCPYAERGDPTSCISPDHDWSCGTASWSMHVPNMPDSRIIWIENGNCTTSTTVDGYKRTDCSCAVTSGNSCQVTITGLEKIGGDGSIALEASRNGVTTEPACGNTQILNTANVPLHWVKGTRGAYTVNCGEELKIGVKQHCGGMGECEYCNFPNEYMVINATNCPAPSSTNAACVSNTIPTTMSTGQTANVSVTMRNSGNTAWINSGSHPEILGSRNTPANLWGGTAVGLPSASIASGADARFNFNITAPTTPGTYPNYWQMASGSDWFGSICGPSTVTVNQSPCTIRGNKFEMPGNEVTALASSQALWLNSETPISILASGRAEGGVYPNMTLKVTLGGKSVAIKSWTVTGTPLYYTTTVPGTITADKVSVHFTNDSGDRDLNVDRIQVLGITYQTENAKVYSVGGGSSCATGYNQTEWLYCNGYFRYSNDYSAFDPTFNFYAFRNIPSGTVTVSSATIDHYANSYKLEVDGSVAPGNSVTFSCAANSLHDLYWYYTCQPDAPNPITLSFPANGAIGVSTTPTLGWHTEVDWGKACTDAGNVYKVYFGTTNPPPYVGLVPSSITTYLVSNLNYSTTYYWAVVANNMNGAVAGNGPASATWSFTTLPPTWWQVMGGNVAGTIVRSDIPSGAINPYINQKSY